MKSISETCIILIDHIHYHISDSKFSLIDLTFMLLEYELIMFHKTPFGIRKNKLIHNDYRTTKIVHFSLSPLKTLRAEKLVGIFRNCAHAINPQ